MSARLRKKPPGLSWRACRPVVQQQLQLFVQNLHVAGRVIVEDNEVNFQTFVMKILVAAQELSHHLQIFEPIHAHQ